MGLHLIEQNEKDVERKNTDELGKAAFQMPMHGISQGFIAGISGGDIGQAIYSGMISSVVSSVTAGLNSTVNLSGTAGDISTMFFGTVSGGLSAELTGGNFWSGARQGLITSGLNHGLHSLVGPQKYTFEKGSETSINVFEVAYISIDAIGGGLSLGKMEIYTTKYDSKIPEGLRGQKVATDLGVTGEFTVNPDTVPRDGKIKPGASLFLGMRGKITFNVTKSGYNLIDFFKDTTTIMSQKTGAAVHVGQLKGYDSSNNLIWSSTTKGGGLSVDIFTRSVFNTEFKQIKY